MTKFECATNPKYAYNSTCELQQRNRSQQINVEVHVKANTSVDKIQVGSLKMLIPAKKIAD